MKKLYRKVAIITGAGSGIGRATALLFAQEGAKVVVADINDDAGKETLKMIKDRGGEAVFVHADVSRSEDVKNMIKKAVNEYGKLDILFNNAGIGGELNDISKYSEQVFDKVIAVNMKGVWLGIKYAVPEMLKGGGGSIINTSSAGGLIGFPGVSAYCASKAGVVGITKVAALEYATLNIRVNCIAPAVIETPLSGQMTPEMMQAQIQMVPMRRAGKPEEVAKVALFLASDDSSFVTGHILSVDGGMLAW
jgi:NAD(P)-dependent dehydrogenase (short-subunit alcohol dehydrogenase family)